MLRYIVINLSGWRGKLLSIAGAVFAVLAYGEVRERKGVRKQRKRTEDAHKEAVADAKEKTNEAIHHVGSLDADGVKRLLKDKWTRD